MAEKVIVVGAGTTGFQVARQLTQDKKDVVVIESNPEIAKYTDNQLDCIVINGSGNKLEFLREAGAEKADVFISTTDSDELNIVTCGLVASEFQIPIKIARVRNPEYANSNLSDRSFTEVDHFVNPEIEAGRAIISSVEQGATSDVLFFSNSDLQMRNLLIGNESPFANLSILEIKETINDEFRIAGVSRDSDFLIPNTETILKKDDDIYLIGNQESLQSVFEKVGQPRIAFKNIMLVGGGRVGRIVADALLGKNNAPGIHRILSYFGGGARRLKIVDSNLNNCHELANLYPRATVLHIDVSAEGFFEDKEHSGYDLIITTTDNPELNILVSLYAKRVANAKRSIALVNKFNYLNAARRLGVDVIISPKYSVVNTILKHIQHGRVKSVQSILGGRAEVIESTLDGSRGFVGKSVREVKLPRNSQIIAVTRAENNIVPGDEFTLRDGDKITILAKTESFARVEEIFNS